MKCCICNQETDDWFVLRHNFYEERIFCCNCFFKFTKVLEAMRNVGFAELGELKK